MQAHDSSLLVCFPLVGLSVCARSSRLSAGDLPVASPPSLLSGLSLFANELAFEMVTPPESATANDRSTSGSNRRRASCLAESGETHRRTGFRSLEYPSPATFRTLKNVFLNGIPALTSSKQRLVPGFSLSALSINQIAACSASTLSEKRETCSNGVAHRCSLRLFSKHTQTSPIAFHVEPVFQFVVRSSSRFYTTD